MPTNTDGAAAADTSEAHAYSKTQLADARRDMDAQKVKDSIKRYKFLLGQTDLFKHFLHAKGFVMGEDDEVESSVEESKALKKKKKNGTETSRRGRKTEKEEDEELLQDELEEEEDTMAALQTETVFQTSPTYVTGGTLRDYQVQGLNWLISMSERRLSGILADEMGLVSTCVFHSVKFGNGLG